MSVHSVVRSTSNALALGIMLAMTLSIQGIDSDTILVSSGLDDTIQTCQFNDPCPATIDVQNGQSTVEQM